MSWLSDRLGIHLGNVGAPVGAAIGSVIPGVGTALGAALGQGIGSLGQGKSVGRAVTSAAGTYAGARGLGSLFGGGPSLPNVDVGALNEGALRAMGMGSSAGSGSGEAGGFSGFLSRAAGLASSSGGGARTGGGGGLIDRIGGFLGLGEMTPADRLQLLGTGLGVVGGAAGAVANANQANADRALRAREADRANALARAATAMSANRLAETAPLRAQVVSALQNSIMAPPTAWRPHDIFTPGGSGPPVFPARPNFAPSAGAGTGADDIYRRVLAMAGYGGRS